MVWHWAPGQTASVLDCRPPSVSSAGNQSGAVFAQPNPHCTSKYWLSVMMTVMMMLLMAVAGALFYIVRCASEPPAIRVCTNDLMFHAVLFTQICSGMRPTFYGIMRVIDRWSLARMGECHPAPPHSHKWVTNERKCRHAQVATKDDVCCTQIASHSLRVVVPQVSCSPPCSLTFVPFS